MTTIPNTHDRVHVNGRRGLFVVVSVQQSTAHVLPLDGKPRLLKVALAEVEPTPEMQARPHPDDSGAI